MDCLFCKMVEKKLPMKKIYENENVLAFLDIHPESNGHTIIIPKKHVVDYLELDSETLIQLYEAAKIIGPFLMHTLDKKGFFLKFNYGSFQEIKHVHLHLVFNHNSDELSIDEVWERLKKFLPLIHE